MEAPAVRTIGKLAAPSEVYTKANWSGWHPRQKLAFVVRKAHGCPVPVFSMDLQPVVLPSGKIHVGKVYTCCSYTRMMAHMRSLPPAHRNFYEIICYDKESGTGDPVNMFFDFDFDVEELVGEEDPAATDKAAAELWACIESVVAAFAKGKVPGWEKPWKMSDTRINIVYGDQPGKKQSRHIVVHLPGYTMFRDIMHLLNFVAFLFHENALRYRECPEDNPWYYEHKEKGWTPMVDHKVYTPNRPFRMVACCKRRMVRSDGRGFLAPRCNHPEGDCASADCPYGPRQDFNDDDFVGNLVSFSLPDPDSPEGLPLTPRLLEVPGVALPWHKSQNDVVTQTTAALLAAAVVPKPGAGPSGGGGMAPMPWRQVLLTNDSNSPVTYSTSIRRDMGWSQLFAQEADPAGTKRPAGATITVGAIMDAIASALSEQTGDHCATAKCDERGSGIISSSSSKCPYVLKGFHKSNHVSFLVELAVPLPKITYYCLDDDCNLAYKTSKHYLPPDPKLFRGISDMIVAYVDAQRIPARVLEL